jgi:hypothetical protein
MTTTSDTKRALLDFAKSGHDDAGKAIRLLDAHVRAVVREDVGRAIRIHAERWTRPDDCAKCGHEKVSHTEEDGGEEDCPYCPCRRYAPPASRSGSGEAESADTTDWRVPPPTTAMLEQQIAALRAELAEAKQLAARAGALLAGESAGRDLDRSSLAEATATIAELRGEVERLREAGGLALVEVLTDDTPACNRAAEMLHRAFIEPASPPKCGTCGGKGRVPCVGAGGVTVPGSTPCPACAATQPKCEPGAKREHDYGPADICKRCGHDSFSTDIHGCVPESAPQPPASTQSTGERWGVWCHARGGLPGTWLRVGHSFNESGPPREFDRDGAAAWVRRADVPDYYEARRIDEPAAAAHDYAALERELTALANEADWSQASDDPHDWRKGLRIVRDRAARAAAALSALSALVPREAEPEATDAELEAMADAWLVRWVITPGNETSWVTKQQQQALAALLRRVRARTPEQAPRQDERGRIVAWLRREADTIERAGEDDGKEGT